MGFPDDSMGKNAHASAGDAGGTSSIPGWGRSREEGNRNLLIILGWKTLWSEELGVLQSTGSQRVGHDWATKHALMLIWMVCKYLEYGLGLSKIYYSIRIFLWNSVAGVYGTEWITPYPSFVVIAD